MDTANPTVDGRRLVALTAPTVAPVLDRLEAAMWREVDPDLVRLAALVAAEAHGVAPLTSPTTDPDERPFDAADDRSRAASAFAEQFALDVGAIDDEVRQRMLVTLGGSAFPFVQATYVSDIIGRLRAVLDRIADATAGQLGAAPDPSVLSSGAETTEADGAADGTLWSAIEDLIRLVPALDGLDPVVTEYVRLRGARAHKCRKCQSLRSRPALAAGADLADLDVIDHYAGRGLGAATEAALAFTDAFVWSPARIPDDVLVELGRHYSLAQQVELVLDIARNATNKIAVALGADGTDVTEGYEVYEVFADGSIEYGLTHP